MKYLQYRCGSALYNIDLFKKRIILFRHIDIEFEMITHYYSTVCHLYIFSLYPIYIGFYRFSLIIFLYNITLALPIAIGGSPMPII